MIRRVHAIFALAASVLVCFMALTGAVLSLNPATEQLATVSASTDANVAQLAAVVAENYADIDSVERTASGSIIVHYYTSDGTASADLIDPATGATLGAYETSGTFGFFTELHRSLFLGDTGRAVAGISAAALAILALSGIAMLVRRLGGWRHLIGHTRGDGSQRLHVNFARFAVVGLMLSALTGIYMSLVTFGLVGDGSSAFLPFPDGVDGGTPAAISELAALQTTPLSQLRELVFPYAGDPTDVFTLTTASGIGYVDQATGALLDFTPNSFGQSLYETIYLLHTGEGAWWLGLLLGLAALSVPVMAASGIAIWWTRRKSLPRLRNNTRASAADTVILVGSEGNSTWGFAGELHRQLTAIGHRVHTAAMNSLARSYPRADRVFVLTATYGDGAAPASANRFMHRLERWTGDSRPAFTVLGFGDRSFPHYCQFAQDVDAALAARGWSRFQSMDTIDRQSTQSFEAWGRAVGAQIGQDLELTHTVARPRTSRLRLIDRTDYGAEVQAPTVVLRFALPASRSIVPSVGGYKRLGSFRPGDLVGILPPDSPTPRYYSLASASRDGFLEICVRKQPGGLCSSFLHGLEVGDEVDAFIKANREFRPAPGRKPVILIGAGTGIAPLFGFAGHNNPRRQMVLYWGGRDPNSDFLYGSALNELLAESRLTRLVAAFSRIVNGSYVQDKVRADAASVRALIDRGAQVLVCGGKDMAAAVRQAIDEIVAPLGTDVGSLRMAGRYLEDIY